VELSCAALLWTLPPPAWQGLRVELARRFLRGDGIEIGALHGPLPLPPEAHVRYVDRLTLAEARVHYRELASVPLVDPSIIAEADALTQLGRASQDFVVCNHVLEHTRDPIGALREWLRVLRPGGHLYVSIPDRSNHHDQHRAVTELSHLLEDHRQPKERRAAADRSHFFDWASSAHRDDMTPEQRRAHAEQLIATGYSIHYHVFDGRLFERVLSEATLDRPDIQLVELQENVQGDTREHIAVLRSRAAREESPGARRRSRAAS
jgi:predicted SAM-dependent methyltransferase